MIHRLKENNMARKTVLVSDLNGEEIADGEEVAVTLTFANRNKGVVRLDVAASEVEQLINAGRPQKRRGRKPAGG